VDFLAINLDNIYENAQKIVKYIGEETKWE
jgi:hypothetical protein